MAHIVDEVTRSEIEMQMHKFLEKIQGKLGKVSLVVVLRRQTQDSEIFDGARLNTDRGVIDAKDVALIHERL